MSRDRGSRSGAERGAAGSVRARAAILLALVSLALPLSVRVADAEEAIRFPDPDNPAVTSDGSVDRSGLRGLWFEWENQVHEGNLEGAARTAEEVQRLAKKFGVRRLTEMSLAAIASGRRAGSEGKKELADAAFAQALVFDPTLPDAEFAIGDHQFRSGNPAGAARHWALGFGKILENIIPRRSMQTSLAFILVIGAFASAIIAWLALTLRYVASFLHDVTERTEEKLGPLASRALGVALLFAPLFLGFSPPYALAFSLLVLWGYCTPLERIVASLAQLALALAPAAILTLADGAVAYRAPLLVGAVNLAEHRFDPAVIDRLEELLQESSAKDAELWWLLGSLYRDSGRNERALAYFKKALDLDPNLADAAINLGSVHYLEGDIPSSIEEYKKSLEIKDSAIANYNLSIAYNESSNFEEGTKRLGEAKRLDPGAVARWVIENRIQNADIPVDRAQRKSAALEGDVGALAGGAGRHFRNPMTVVVGALFLLTPFFHLARKFKLPYAGACVKCGRTYCRRCKAATESGIYCSQCVHIFLKKDGVAIDTKMAKVEEVKHYVRREAARRRWTSLALPGVAQFVSGHPFRGLLLGFAFFGALAGSLLLWRLYRPVMVATQVAGWSRGALAVVAVVIWLLANLRVLRPGRIESQVGS
jgi:tetratricopeptide (TPR) repeat protein